MAIATVGDIVRVTRRGVNTAHFQRARVESIATYYEECGPVYTLRRMVENEWTGELKPTSVLMYMVPAFDCEIVATSGEA